MSDSSLKEETEAKIPHLDATARRNRMNSYGHKVRSQLRTSFQRQQKVKRNIHEEVVYIDTKGITSEYDISTVERLISPEKIASTIERLVSPGKSWTEA